MHHHLLSLAMKKKWGNYDNFEGARSSDRIVANEENSENKKLEDDNDTEEEEPPGCKPGPPIDTRLWHSTPRAP